MSAVDTVLPEVRVLEHAVHLDDRGSFSERFHARRFAEAGLPTTWAQDNHARSRYGVLRGLHYQLRRPQGKLVTVIRGSIFDVAVDIRRGSPTFGHWVAITLSEEDGRSVWIPPGFAHGYCVTSDVADVLYKCTDVYAPGDDHGVLWSDRRLAIPWPVADPVLSAKDLRCRPLDEARTDLPEYARP